MVISIEKRLRINQIARMLVESFYNDDGNYAINCLELLAKEVNKPIDDLIKDIDIIEKNVHIQKEGQKMEQILSGAIWDYVKKVS